MGRWKRWRDKLRKILPGVGPGPIPIPIPLPIPLPGSGSSPIPLPVPAGVRLPLQEEFNRAVSSVQQGLKLPEGATDLLEIRSKLMRKIGQALGGEAEKILADAESYFHPVTDEAKTAALHGLLKWLETGDLNYMQPIVILTIGQLRKARNDLWDKAYPIPASIIQAMPAELHPVLGKCRMMQLSDVPGKINYPNFAVRHLNESQNCTLIDLVVFDPIPPQDTNHDYAHEFWHLHQFDVLGVEEFVKQYLTADFKPKTTGGPDDDVNAMEREADYFACRHFPIPNPAYVDHCPVIAPHSS
ncbi:hypothetical protein [Bradyrhizobium sp. AUGA SZCCT0042]|uniref:hypothetical protein n=1 Tax=Bradyrhizobium sp. AUGA SZCCT0042 TaxID=2807651 RepID=UPI001BA6AA98|nr:hypothetical protein [Bradyrhizobium sp. AUGA SZCCT0042]MBR1296636.1 hypothetical protein [Bradyrhizobium sp. AUGA SZCCT0042]